MRRDTSGATAALSRDGRPAERRGRGISRRRVLGAAASVGTASLLPAPAAAQTGGSSDTDHRVVSYYTSWSRYDRDYLPADVPLDRITDLNFAFLTVEQDGTVTYADEWGDRENLAAFRDLKADHPDTRFYLSVGGWSDSTYFSDAAATPENRERFAATAIEILREYEFDGIDVDWEYPGGGGAAGNVTREDDPENFVLLLEELRSQLDAAEVEDGRDGAADEGYGITVAASANPSVAGNLPIAELEPYLEYVTVMSYDYAGSWSSVTGHNAPLHADGPCVADSMAWWADQPIPREKLLVGLPFYGRAFETVDGGGSGSGTDDGLGQSFDSSSMVLYGNLDQYPLDGSYTEFRDDEARVPYRYSGEESTFVSYDDAESIAAKTGFAVDRGFGGVTIWEQAGDPDGTLLDAVHEHLVPVEEPRPCGGADGATATEVDGREVCDMDGDGLHRDVTGDGDLGQDDVVHFFENQHREAWQAPELFDYSENGSVGHGDVVELFEHVATS